MKKSEAVKAWRRWRLYNVEREAGHRGTKVAAIFFKSFYWIDVLPQGRYFALCQNDQEVGFAFTCRREGELELGVFPRETFFSGPQTAMLVSAMASYLKSPIRHLTLTQKHADSFASSAPFDYERHRDEERLTLFRLRSADGTA